MTVTAPMLNFCGQDRCLMDGSGRIKLSQHWLDDFAAVCKNGEIVLHCLPEGAVAVYPESVYAEMRRREMSDIKRAASSFVARRNMRRFGALTAMECISRQGRVTVPPPFREYASLEPGTELCVIGVELGLELWNVERYRAEMAVIQKHLLEKGEQEMTDDVVHERGNDV